MDNNNNANDRCAVAARLAAALGAYRHEVVWLGRGWDANSYRTAASLFEQLRNDAAWLPPLRVHWLEVLISRFEFSHALWEPRPAASPASGERLRACQARHLAAVDRFHAVCVLASGGE